MREVVQLQRNLLIVSHSDSQTRIAAEAGLCALAEETRQAVLAYQAAAERESARFDFLCARIEALEQRLEPQTGSGTNHR
jgi:hypothetical protein